MLGFFFRHYDPLVQRYVIYDDGSRDGSPELLRAHPKVELRPMPEPTDPDSYVVSGLALLEQCWKESQGAADWVIVTDIDEHLHHSNLKDYLAACQSQGVTIVPALGYQMLSERFPEEDRLLSATLTMGAPDPRYCKLNIFSPNAISAVNFIVGRHSAAPQGIVVAPARDELLLLHYKYLGFGRTRRRYKQYRTRRRKKDLSNAWGVQYSWSRRQLLKDWNECAARLVDISMPDARPWETYPAPVWWSGYPRAAQA